MRKLLNTLFITGENAFLLLDGETVCVEINKKKAGQFPLHTLESIVCFTYNGATPAFMGACAKRGIHLAFFNPFGKFLCRAQYLTNAMVKIKQEEDLESLRGIEGECASVYFGAFDELILNQKEAFYFRGRNKRPPMDNVNAMLSFGYTLLANDCAGALEGAGLDSYVGFLHRDRPGRRSLALDLMEEMRAVLVDRFVLTLINNRQIRQEHFRTSGSGAIEFTDDGRKKFITAWQEHKREQITHPYLQEKICWGLVPHVQALLLARYLRGDIDGYPPFLWK